MAYTIQWYDTQQRHILVTVVEQLPYEDTIEILHIVLEMRENSPQRGYLIMDMRKVRRSGQFRVDKIREIINHPLSTHPNHAGTHLVLAGAFALIFIDAMKHIFPAVLKLMEVHGTLHDVNHKLGLNADELLVTN
ncbi:MAG: hypothetical protein SNJ54_08615 [Anaerolineae bacterium]